MQKGFYTITAIIIGLVVIAGGAGVYFYTTKNTADTVTENEQPAPISFTETPTQLEIIQGTETVQAITDKEMTEGISFIIPEDWVITENAPTKIVLRSEKDDVSNGDVMALSFIPGDRYESFDAKFGSVTIDKNTPHTDEYPIFNGIKRWRTYVVMLDGGFVEIHVTGGGDTSAIEEVKNSIKVLDYTEDILKPIHINRALGFSFEVPDGIYVDDMVEGVSQGILNMFNHPDPYGEKEYLPRTVMKIQLQVRDLKEEFYPDVSILEEDRQTEVTLIDEKRQRKYKFLAWNINDVFYDIIDTFTY